MAAKYLVSDKSGDHLPVTGDDGKPDHRLMGAAWAALHGGYRGNKYEGPNKAEAISKLTALYKSEGMDTPGGSSSDHADLNGQWIEIFRAGDYGKNGSYTPQDLQHIVEKYNPDFHEAPAVIGHPETNAPAYGWVAGVKCDGGTLLAQLRDVDPQFEEMVKSGAFKKRSASFYRKPDGIELRHIGFLGAQPPEVKGLAAIKFEEGFETAEVVFEEASMAEQKTVAQEIQSFFEGLFGKKTDTAQFSEAALRPLIDAANASLLAKVTDLETKLAKQTTDFAERERKLVSGEHSGLVAEAVNKLRTAGNWVPAFEKMGLKVVFAELAKVTDTIEFGEADKDGKKRKETPLAILSDFLAKLPKIVPGGVRVTDDNLLQFSEAPRSGKRDANLPPGSMNSARLHEMTVEFMEKNPTLKLSYGEALSQVAEKNPELTMPGGVAAGAV